ncbi:MAG: glycosyltransferase [Bacilli bacterium]|nr:glycosyltransferase [Bacilli bacterium]
MKLAGVVVLFNPSNLVLDSINTYIDDVDVLYAVDNSSVDNSELFKNKKIRYVANMDNLGIARALNIGADMAINDGYKYLLTMDQDSKFENKGVYKLKQMIINYSKNKILIDKFGSNVNKIGLYSPVHVINNDPSIMGISNDKYDSPINVMTSGNIINLDSYKKIGGFKDWFFIDCVDFDYCLNLRKNGYEIIRNNSIVLNHELGSFVEKKIFGKIYTTFEHNYIRRYYIVRNRHYLYDMYKDDFKDYCELEKKCTKREFKLVWLCEKHKIKKTWYMLKGYLDYKKGKKGKIK